MKLKITTDAGSVWTRPLNHLMSGHISHLRRMIGKEKFSELSVIGKTEVKLGNQTVTYELIKGENT